MPRRGNSDASRGRSNGSAAKSQSYSSAAAAGTATPAAAAAATVKSRESTGSRDSAGSRDRGQSGASRFDAACRQIRQASQLHISRYEQQQQQQKEEEVHSHSDEEELDDDVRAKILERVCVGRGEDGDGQQTVLEHLSRALDSDGMVCLICIDSVRRRQQVWTCQPCRVTFHLVCIGSWARDRLAQLSMDQQQQQQQSSSPSSLTELTWNCPNCRCCYARDQVPLHYTCYCGRQPDPQPDPWLLPHTCGEVCGRQLTPPCRHKCLLRCHPGPCAPCPVIVQTVCHCGRSATQPKRCSQALWSCQKQCSKLLTCQTHRCEQICHPGDCPPCQKTRQVACRCGSESTRLSCATTEWKCSKVCNAPLSCGHHLCTEVCHAGACPPCPNSGPRTCPCGATSHRQLACTQLAPVCGSTCNKLLDCGCHRCSSRCHQGPCGECLQLRAKRCRCGRREKETVCNKPYLCDIKCKRMRQCGRHTCGRKCCSGDCGVCERTCDRQLACRKHRCQAPCHSGSCYPCTRTEQLRCACGSTQLQVPCGGGDWGAGGRSRRLRCRQPCRAPSSCHHPARAPHLCHPPPCPPCRLPCDRPLSGCSHRCVSACHDAVPRLQLLSPSAVAAAATPWQRHQQLLKAQHETVCAPCPPCQVSVSVECVGGHCGIDMPCCEAVSRTCGAVCGRPLSCGNHTCCLQCHPPSVECEQCQLPCQVSRASGCKHPCATGGCHPPPCPPCRQHRRVACHCGVTQLFVRCHELTDVGFVTGSNVGGNTGSETGSGAGGKTGSDSESQLSQLERMLCCGNTCPKMLDCGHRCAQLCHSGACCPPDGGCQVRCRVKCPCGRRIAAVPCAKQQQEQQKQLSCDRLCEQKQQQQQQMQQERERALADEKEQERVRQLEQAQYLLPGAARRKQKRRRPDVTSQHVQHSRFWPLSWQHTVLGASLLLLACLVCWISWMK